MQLVLVAKMRPLIASGRPNVSMVAGKNPQENISVALIVVTDGKCRMLAPFLFDSPEDSVIQTKRQLA
jgi:hypothetical protein